MLIKLEKSWSDILKEIYKKICSIVDSVAITSAR